MLRRAVLAALVAALAGCGGGSDSGASELFAYDEGQPVALEHVATTPSQNGVVIRNVSYASGDDRVEALIASPDTTAGERPAVVLLHGAGGDRTEQVPFAAALAKRGITALTLTVPSRTKMVQLGLTPEVALRSERDRVAADVIAVRRAYDLLAEDDEVDDDRLGLVGWSRGARLASIVAAVDDRVRATVLMSAGAAPVSEYVAAAPEELRDDVREALTPVDPLAYVGNVHGALFVQAGRSDSIVPQQALRTMAAAAPEDARVVWYDADHALDERAERDRFAWLEEQLGH